MNRKLLLLAGALSGMAVTASAQTVRSYVTLPDRSALYSESEEYEFSDVRDDRGGRSSYIVIDPRQSFQPVDGFGFALTGGSAEIPQINTRAGNPSGQLCAFSSVRIKR